jgi:hypothetical protein
MTKNDIMPLFHPIGQNFQHFLLLIRPRLNCNLPGLSGRVKTEKTFAYPSTILHPTMEPAAREQAIVVQEPVRGVSQADVVMRPVKLLELDELVRDRDSQACKPGCAYAAQLAFGAAA